MTDDELARAVQKMGMGASGRDYEVRAISFQEATAIIAFIRLHDGSIAPDEAELRMKNPKMGCSI